MVAIAAIFSIGGFFVSHANAQAYTPTSVFVDSVQQIPNASSSAAVADNNFDHGWRWVFYVTVPDTYPHNETLLKMKFADWMNGSNIIPAGGNMRFYSLQSTNATSEATAIPITSSTTWSDIMDLNPNIDLNSTNAGRQIEIYVEAKIPTTAISGSYSTSYDINTTATSTITIASTTQTYDGAPEPVSITTDPDGLANTVTYTGINTTTYGPSTTAPTHVGTYNAYAEVTDSGYTATSTATLTINPAPVSVVADPKTKIYGTTDPVLTSTTTPPLFGSDSFTGALARSPGENVGSYLIATGTLAIDGDYVLTFVPNYFTITQAGPLTITGLTAQNKPYDGTLTDPITGTPVLNGIIGTDDVTLTGTPVGTFSDKNAGTGLSVTVSGLSLTGTAATNYTLSLPTLSADITKLPITANITADSRTYDGNTNATTECTLVGVINPPDVVTCSAASASFADKDVGDGKTVTATGITLGGTDAGNYTLGGNTTATALADITVSPLTITAKDETKTYGSTFSFNGDEFTTSGLLDDDSVSSVTLTSDGSVATALVSGLPYSIVASDAVGNGLSNYTITYTNGSLDVTTAPVTVTIDSKTKVYDGNPANPVLTYTTTSGSLFNGDEFSGELTRVAGENVGEYDITQGTLALNDNYALTVVPSTLTINNASQVINFPSIPGKTFGDADFTVSATGGASSNPVTFSTPSTGICSVTGDTVHIIAGGTCTVVASQAGHDNYDAAPDVSQSFHITAANLILTVSSTTATIAQSDHLISEGTYGNADNNSDLDSLVSGGLQPIAVRLQNIGDAASAKVRISPINAGTHIQFWAKDTSGNWYDINVSGWIDTAGLSIPSPYDVSTNIYVISDTVGSYNLTVNLVDAANPATIVASTTGIVTVKDMTPPTLSITGFTENGVAMNGSIDDGYTLNTDNNPNTHYTIQFATGSVASEKLEIENVALTLIPTSTQQTADLQTFYSTNYPTQYQTYLDAAAAGTQPFAFIKTDGTTAIKILDGAQYTLNNQAESDMIVPGNYPLGTYTVKGTIHDIAGNSTDVTFKLIVAGDRIPPVGGQLTMVTKLHPNGITIASSTGGTYSLPPLSLDGADVFQSMSVVVTDETAMSTTSVPVYVDGTENGQMVYSGSGNVWNYEGQTSVPVFSSGPHSFTATFSDNAGNKTTLTATFTTDNTPPTATVTQSGTDGGTIIYTFDEPVQLTSNDSSIVYTDPSQIADKLAVYAVIGSDYTTASKVSGVTITNVATSSDIWTLTYTGTLVNQTNTKYVVDAWGYRITDLAGNKMLPTESAMFTVLSPSQLITIGNNINGSISATADTGSSPKYEISANSGYYISDVLVDNVSVINQNSSIGSFVWKMASTTASYTFTNVIAPHTLSAVFTLIPPQASNPITGEATDIKSSDATLNGTNGPSDAIGHSFWVSLTPGFDISSPTLPAGVYSTSDLGAITAGTSFSAQLSSVTGLPTVAPNTPYYFVAWSNVGGTWYPGTIETFTTADTTVGFNGPHYGPPFVPITSDPIIIDPASGTEVATGTRIIMMANVDNLDSHYSQSTLA